MNNSLNTHKIRAAAFAQRAGRTFTEASLESGITRNALWRLEKTGRPGPDIMFRFLHWVGAPMEDFIHKAGLPVNEEVGL